QVEAMAGDADGSIFLAGQFSDTLELVGDGSPLTAMGFDNLFVAKLSPSADIVWAKQYGDGMSLPSAQSVAVTTAGPVVVGDVAATVDFGTTQLTPSGPQNVFVVQLSP